MIKLAFIGHLGKDATVNQVNGKNVINFTAAHSETYNDNQGQQQTKTTWVDFSYWTDKTAVAPYLTKGTQVYIEGQPEVRTYQKADQSTGASMAVRVWNLQLLGAPKQPAQQQQQQPAQQPFAAAPQASTPPPPPAPQWNGSAWINPVWNGQQWVMPGAAPVQQPQQQFQQPAQASNPAANITEPIPNLPF